MFLSSHEAALINRDFEQGVSSPEAGTVTLRYSTYLEGQDEQPDEEYNTDSRDIDPVPVQVQATCWQKIVTEQNLKLFPQGFLNVGDCIFYFSSGVSIDEPEAGKPMVPHTLEIVDAGGIQWTPKMDNPALNQSLVVRVGNSQIGQAVPASIRT